MTTTPSLLNVAQRGGLQPQGREAWSPCPVCGAEKRGREDRRGPLTFRAEHWRCHAGGCAAGGGAVALYAALRFHEIPSTGDVRWREVYAALGVEETLRPRSRPTRFYTPRSTASPPHRLGDVSGGGVVVPPLPYPPAADVAVLWNACRRLRDTTPADPAREALARRGIDPHLVDQLDLARVLPDAYPWPDWLPRTVPRYYRLAVPMFDSAGVLRSLRFRTVGDLGKGPKALPPRGYGLSGLVMADSVAQALLRGQRADDEHMPWDGRVVIAEGETDWWSLAAHSARHDRAIAEQRTWAVFGIVAGSWSNAIAARIPTGAQVVIWTDLDPAGDRYADIIRVSLAHRCDVQRRPTGVAPPSLPPGTSP